jgi:hypothetical protein
MATDSPRVVSHGGSTPPIGPATPSTSKGLRQKLGSLFQRPSSRSKKSDATEPKPVGAKIAPEQSLQASSTIASETLLVTTDNIDIKQDTIDPARKAAGYELAIRVIEIFQPVVECTNFILPTPVGKGLEQLTKVLGVLKGSSLRDDSGPADTMRRRKWWRIKRHGRGCTRRWFIMEINSTSS